MKVFGPVQFNRSISTLKVTGLSEYGFLTIIYRLYLCLESHLISMWFSARGSSPMPLRSYSNWSIVVGLAMTSLASALLTHLGLNVTGKLPVDFFLTGKSLEYWDGMLK
jgi:hypothetical protein